MATMKATRAVIGQAQFVELKQIKDEPALIMLAGYVLSSVRSESL